MKDHVKEGGKNICVRDRKNVSSISRRKIWRITAVNVVERPPHPDHEVSEGQRGGTDRYGHLLPPPCCPRGVARPLRARASIRAPRAPVASRRSPSASVGACGAGKDWSLTECLHCVKGRGNF